MSEPTFVIEEYKVGLGYRVVAECPDGHREVATGFGDRDQAERWVAVDAANWLLDIPKNVQGEQWINDRLPKAE